MPSRVPPAACFTPLQNTILFTPLSLGAINLSHRIILAPLTRMRGTTSSESDGVYIPSDLAVEYYAQRASKGGLMITEACPISRLACGYPRVPGIFTPSQIAGWKRVTDAVHDKGAFIYCQLWHVGRATVPSLLNGEKAVSASEIALEGNALDGSKYSDAPPRALTVEEIGDLTREFANAAKRAVKAGFDGVEIHGANGYLLDQFLHDNVNVRTDLYGGSIENRARFPLEVIKAVTSAIGAEKVGIRLSPFNYFQDTHDSRPIEHWNYLCEQIARLPESSRPAYVHMVEPRFDELLDEIAKLESLEKSTTTATSKTATATAGRPSLASFRRILAAAGVRFLSAGGFTRDNAVPTLENDGADAVVFGRWFIANPDLPYRLAHGLALNAYDRNTFYGADPPAKGYVDYPFAAPASNEVSGKMDETGSVESVVVVG